MILNVRMFLSRHYFVKIVQLTWLLLLTPIHALKDVDPAGYVAYCPCMGRFGNQADHFLGALAFAKGINRTLILPHWVEYRTGEAKSIQVPFEKYFSVEALQEYHKVITMTEFMRDLADSVWPVNKRTSFCYVPRGDSSALNKSCMAKEGNPFGPFWDTFKIDFVDSEFYAPLHYDIHRGDMSQRWNLRYPAHKWPVLAFTGAPASFPVQSDNINVHKYLQWNDIMMAKAKDFIKEHLTGGFIGIHLRNGRDWIRACDHVPQSPTLFSSPQCVGYKNEFGPVTMEMCMPSFEEILRKLKRQLKINKDIKHIYVASDSNHMKFDLEEGLKHHNIEINRLIPTNPHMDLAIMRLSNHFIGNCVSSFSAFVKRGRDVIGLPSSFWGFPTEKSRRSSNEEL